MYIRPTKHNKMSSKNYIKKLQETTNLDQELRIMLVNFHEKREWKSPYRLEMQNPKLSVSISWHNTITSALDRAKMLTGDFTIQFNQTRILTLQECEAIQQCEKGELDIPSGCCIAHAMETRALREKEQSEEEIEWIERLSQTLQEKAMEEILAMSAKEFQTRLLDGTLPDFPREQRPVLVRDTCHEKRLLAEKDFEHPELISNYGEHHRNRLRYMSTEEYKYDCYPELSY